MGRRQYAPTRHGQTKGRRIVDVLLRLTQEAAGNAGEYIVRLRLEGDGAPIEARAAGAFIFDDHDQADLRWYLEDYLQFPFDPAPQVAKRIEGRMRAIGEELFRALFQANDETRDLWAVLRPKLAQTRVEIVADVAQAAAIPWELLRDPTTDEPLALRARAFVRAHTRPALRPRLPQTAAGEPIRILLVICRPGGAQDVPFRSVAARLVRGLSAADRQQFQLDVLRPPTFAQLARTLRTAARDGRPYHVVHFDGHGAYLDGKEKPRRGDLLRGLVPHALSGLRQGQHGYLLFEDPQQPDNVELVDGPTLGKLLAETGVPVLALNACRSAHAAPQPPPSGSGAPPANVHEEVRAYGSLAHEITHAGVAGVVAMRYNVYVVTAAQFVADLYAALGRGLPLGEAATLGRQQLAAQPLREIAFRPLPLQDWLVPVVYEVTPIHLFPRQEAGAPPHLQLNLGRTAAAADLAADLPAPPDVGFFGRDETLLALDRAFDHSSVVLLHGYAGSGKTTTAVEFARWYAQTGGVRERPLFTTFEQHRPLARVLDQLGAVFGDALAQSGVQWLTLDDEARRQVALQVMAQVPLLWIWDNVEPVAGFPSGTESVWSAAEQAELADFLRAARGTKAKFLLTSRRDERGWLGELPARVTLPPMPFQERAQLARALAEKQGRRLADSAAWQPLLEYSQGNPMTITVLVGQALRDGLGAKEEIEAYVARLRAGEAAFADEPAQGRARSLGASLAFGFAHAFHEEERRILALLHHFQGFVDVDVLIVMGDPDEEWSVPAARELSRERGIALLDRAAEIGLLTPHGGGYYTIHPALPWFFKNLHDEYYATDHSPLTTDHSPLTTDHSPLTTDHSPLPTDHSPLTTDHSSRAFVEAMGELGNYYWGQYEGGNREVIGALRAEEGNLLHARRLARQHGWWDALIRTMQGLRQLYVHTGRRGEWARLVREITPEFVEAATEGPLPGREAQWSLVTEYRVGLAREQREWGTAERLQRVCVAWDRQAAAAALGEAAAGLDGAGRNAIRTLAASLHELGQIQREQNKAACVAAYEEAADLLQRIGDGAAEAIAAFNLGHAYMQLPALRDLDAAERWYRRSLELRAGGDRVGRGKCLITLGNVAYERFNDGQAAGQAAAELLGHLNAALGHYQQALALLPPDAVGDLAVTHNQLGNIYADAGDLERALAHYNESIRYKEQAGNFYLAATTRFNVALALAQNGRLADARLYAQAAQRDFQRYPPASVAADVQDTERLLAAIEQALD